MAKHAQTRRERAEAGLPLPCTNCGQKFDAAEFGWRPAGGRRRGPKCWCRACDRAASVSREKRRAPRPPGRRKSYRPEVAAAYKKSPRGRVLDNHKRALYLLRKAEEAGKPAARIAVLRGHAERWAAARDAMPKTTPARAATEARRLAAYDSLARWGANGFRRLAKRTGTDWDDLYGLALLGLVKAARDYDPLRGLKFTTAATHYIRTEIRNGLRRGGGFVGPAHDHTRHAPVFAVDPSTMSVAAEAEDGPAPYAPADDARARLAPLLARLDSRSRTVLHLRYGITGGRSRTPHSVALQLRTDEATVRRIEAAALATLARIAAEVGVANP